MSKKDTTFKKRDIPYELSEEKQEEIILFVKETFDGFSSQMKEYRELMLDVYEATSTFVERTDDGLPRIVINKANQVLNEATPKVFAKPPRMKVSPRVDVFYKKDMSEEERKELQEKQIEMAKAAQNFLRVFFKKRNIAKKLKIWARSTIGYGNGYVQIVPKYDIQRSKGRDMSVSEGLIDFRPDIENVSLTEVYYDPRYRVMDDMPAIVRVKDKLRLQQLHFEKDEQGNKKYFNLDKLQKVCDVTYEDSDQYKNELQNILGISPIEHKKAINKNELGMKIFEGYFSLTGDAKDERLFQITTVNDTLVIGIEEITQFSLESADAFEDLEHFHSTGIIAPMMGVQDETNYLRNAYAEAIDKTIHKRRVWDPNSGVDPRDLLNESKKIIPAQQGLAAYNNGVQYEESEPVPPQYFTNLSYNNSEIKQLSHTAGAGAPSMGQDGVDIATGRRLDFYETNTILGEVRKNFEESLERLCYRVLAWVADNVKENIVIQDDDTQEFFDLNIEVFKDALQRYAIVVEQDSTGYDEQVNRRNNAIAKKNAALDAVKAGQQVDLEAVYKELFDSFDGVNPMNSVDPIQSMLGPQEPIKNLPSGGKEEVIEEKTPESLVAQVASGKT